MNGTALLCGSAVRRPLLLRHGDGPHAAFAELLQQLVRAHDGAELFGDERLLDGARRQAQAALKKTARLVVRREQGLDFPAQLVVGPTSLVEVCGAPFRCQF
ncbi:MAG TPA: hypothetical protein VFA18_00480 [Gemmataceae bacterium]|nr:hypothetical protein [Gemmataceae bacterium]